MNTERRRAALRLAIAGGLTAALLAIACLVSTTVWAKAGVAGSSPADGSSAPVGLQQIVITFTEAIDPDQSTAQLLVQGQQAVEGVTTRVDRANPTNMSIQTASPLPEGRYKVRWHVLAVSDNTRTDGEINFAVGNPPPAAPQATATSLQSGSASSTAPTLTPTTAGTAPTQTSSSQGDGLVWLLLAIIAVLAVVVIVQRVALRRRT